MRGHRWRELAIVSKSSEGARGTLNSLLKKWFVGKTETTSSRSRRETEAMPGVSPSIHNEELDEIGRFSQI